MAKQIGSAAYADMFDLNTGTGFAPGAIEMSNAAYDEMFSAEAGYPQRPAESEQPQGPEEIYAGRLKAETKELDEQYNQARSSAEEAPKRAVQQLKEQMRIKWDAYANDRSLDAAVKTKKQDALVTQFEVQSVAINGKAAPDLEQVEQIYQEEQRKRQMKAQADAQTLAALNRVNSAEAKQEAWKLIGVDVSLSSLQTKAGTVGSLEQQQDDLRQDIGDLTGELSRLDNYRWNDRWFRGDRWERNIGTKANPKWVKAGITQEEGAALEARREGISTALRDRRKKLSSVIIKGDPTIAHAVQVQDDWAAAGSALSKNGRNGGGLKEGLIKAKGKPPSKMRVVAPDGTTGTIEIAEWGQHQLQGFKRIE